MDNAVYWWNAALHVRKDNRFFQLLIPIYHTLETHYLRQNLCQQFFRLQLPISGQIVLHRLISENVPQNLWNSSIIFENTSFLQFHTYTYLQAKIIGTVCLTYDNSMVISGLM